MSQFADDGAIWKSGPNLKHLQNKIQQDLDNINKWCSTWGFLLSPIKTIGIIFFLFNIMVNVYHPVSKTVKCLNLLMMEQYGNQVLI